MILAGFPKKDTTNEIMRRMIRHHFEVHEAKKRTPRRDAPTVDVLIAANSSVISPLAGGDNDTGPTHPKPKRKQIRLTASAIQQRRIDDLSSTNASPLTRQGVSRHG
jgi:hypothetical protein